MKTEEKHEKEKQELRNYINKLLEKTYSNTTINIDKQLNQDNSNNQNIILNSYGNEDLSHITENMKLNFLKLPYTSIQNMIEQVHFNNNKPENKNIALTNKKEKMIKVYKDNKWRYKDRDETLDELIQINYGRLDQYYEKEGLKKISSFHNERYKNYQKKFDIQDMELMNEIKKDAEMIILSDKL